jgi:hypothetical protein
LFVRSCFDVGIPFILLNFRICPLAKALALARTNEECSREAHLVSAIAKERKLLLGKKVTSDTQILCGGMKFLDRRVTVVELSQGINVSL